ncbi:MAG: hypothetical protein M3P91_09045 [Actinomycetota bacterium]|nr:hypothetical protein [Actinomycetota bacterium]
MKKTLAYAALTTVVAAGMALGTSGAASAAHCVKGDSPGFSYFGQDGREDGDPTPGASVCRERTGSPSERAPGQQ